MEAINTKVEKSPSEPYFMKKSPVFHLPLKQNEILVTRKKHPAIYLKRIHKLFFDMA
jgi:hypothetical protein